VCSVSTTAAAAAAWYNERVVVVCDVSDDFVCLIERQTRCSYACKADEIIIIIIIIEKNVYQIIIIK
jgi:hypothetical protein